MKKYEPQTIVSISRYQRYFPTLEKDIQEDVYARMRELIQEEKEYCDKGNFLEFNMTKAIRTIRTGSRI